MIKKRILLYGDSNTHGYRGSDHLRFEKPLRWTTIAEERAGDGFELINKGMNGRTACCDEPLFPFRNGLKYIEPCILTHLPVDMVCVMLGTNDLKKEFGLSAKDIALSCGKVLAKARDVMDKTCPGNTCRYLLMSPIEVSGDLARSKWVDDYEGEVTLQKSRDFSRCYAEVAATEGFLFFDAALYGSPCTDDGIHLSGESHKSLGFAFGSYLLELEKEGIL